MKNYVVFANCEITDPNPAHGIEAAGAPGVRESYHTMFRCCEASMRENLRGEWESIVLDQPQPSRIAMFQHNYQEIRRLWHSEPCNILFVDSDTVMVRPVEIFGRWQQFRLFNWTTPSKHTLFENYFNCAVRYFPAEMTAECWSTGDAMFAQWDHSIYDHEQLMFNQMFWSQNIAWNDAHHPEMNWQAESGINIEQMSQHWGFNTFPINHARIIHYHGTRSHQRGAQIAQLLCAEIGIVV